MCIRDSHYIGYDDNGEASLAWGVAAVPESFFISGDGLLRYHHRGALTAEHLRLGLAAAAHE